MTRTCLYLIILSCFYSIPGLCYNGFSLPGDSLWLRYRPVNFKKQSAYINALQKISVGDQVSDVVKKELLKAVKSMIQQPVSVIQTPDNPAGSYLDISLKEGFGIKKAFLENLGKEGYVIRSVQKAPHRIITIKSASNAGLLYGVFHFLRLLQMQASLNNLDIIERPALAYRMLNQWDNLNGSIERGYAGKSIYNWQDLSGCTQRIQEFARANASIGINSIVINNVNADPRILSTNYLKKVSAVAAIFRRYHIRLFLSVNFASCLKPSATPDKLKQWGGIGTLETADPFNKQVQAWWKTKIKEIYTHIPDFGGFLVKANAEGMPGPQNYGRSHADGANMLAKLLQPFDGILIWRAFVYAQQQQEPDRAKQSYREFYPLDGSFEKNVVLQIKNGPFDFQPLEPPHPLFGALRKTNFFAELQLTQEYLGHANYLVYLAPMWKKFLTFNTHGTSVANQLRGHSRITGMAGVANAGNEQNWTGHYFGQANWYAFGRLAWNPSIEVDTITKEWIRLTWGADDRLIDTIQRIMNKSWQAFVNLQTPFGLILTTDPRNHYKPALRQRANHYWQINQKGIGYNRTTRGSEYTRQYDRIAEKKFDNIHSCPEAYLLFFHFVNWQHRLKSGQPLREALVSKIHEGYHEMAEMSGSWKRLRPQVDKYRYAAVEEKFSIQLKDAAAFRDAFIDFLASYRNLKDD